MWEFVLGMLCGAVLTGALAGVWALGTLEKLFEERDRIDADRWHGGGR